MLVSDPRLSQGARDFWVSFAADPAVAALARVRAARAQPPFASDGDTPPPASAPPERRISQGRPRRKRFRSRGGLFRAGQAAKTGLEGVPAARRSRAGAFVPNGPQRTDEAPLRAS